MPWIGAPGARGIFAAALSLALARVAYADVVPSVEPGYREINRTLALDSSALPAGQVALFSHRGKFGSTNPTSQPNPFRSPYPLSRSLTDSLVVVVTTRQVADTKPTLEELERQHFVPRRLDGPRGEDVPESDRRWSLERKARINADGSVEVLEDVYSDRAGAVVCRRAPITEEDFDEGRDPCDPSAPWRRAKLFVSIHHVALEVGGASVVAMIGAALFARQRRKRSKP